MSPEICVKISEIHETAYTIHHVVDFRWNCWCEWARSSTMIAHHESRKPILFVSFFLFLRMLDFAWIITSIITIIRMNGCYYFFISFFFYITFVFVASAAAFFDRSSLDTHRSSSPLCVFWCTIFLRWMMRWIFWRQDIWYICWKSSALCVDSEIVCSDRKSREIQKGTHIQNNSQKQTFCAWQRNRETNILKKC